MINDRGYIKWNSLMLPEHKKLLGKFYKEEEHILQPEIADDKCEEINNILVEALRDKKDVVIQTNENFNVQKFSGIITGFYYKEKMLKLKGYSQETFHIKIENIIDVKFI